MTRPVKRERGTASASSSANTSSTRSDDGGDKMSESGRAVSPGGAALRSRYLAVKNLIIGTFSFFVVLFFNLKFLLCLRKINDSPTMFIGPKSSQILIIVIFGTVCIDEREDIGKVDSDKFHSIFHEVESLHQLGTHYCCPLSDWQLLFKLCCCSVSDGRI